MTDNPGFLPDLMSRPWSLEAKHGFRATGLFIGKGPNAIEVAVAHSSGNPIRTALLGSWKARRGGRAAPVLLVVLHPGGAALCGASGEEPPVYPNIDAGQVERLCREVLDQPDRHAALRFLSQALPSLETTLPGLNNEGLVALHELQHGLPRQADWAKAARKAARALGKRDGELLTTLGYKVERLDNLTSLLRRGDRRTALAVLLRESESPEAGTARFNSLSPVSYALTKADAENLPWVVLVQGNRLRLYSTAVDAGVGRRGRTETYIECQPSLLSDEHLPYLWLLYSAEALAVDGSLSQILENSQRFAGDLAERLRERIYGQVVPELAQGIAAARNLRNPRREDLDRTYEMALTVLFRLLFIAYAEDRDLLPYRFNEAYRRRSLKQKAQELAECVANGTPIAKGNSHWQEVALLWQAVAIGNKEWGVPAYDGGLFTDDPAVSEASAALATITLPNKTFEAALRGLLVIETPEGVPGPVDFRSLGVREFGTVYEGLLESELSVADVDLALDKKGSYVPARARDTVVVGRGEIYLHNRSGARKSSGSYYTKHFAVEHLLDGALEPALADHFARLARLDDTDAAEAFFDFRVADIAMGSGHFLIAAIDRIEKGMADYLAKRDLPGVRRELAALRDAAIKELGELAETVTIEDGQLLRRMIARRCIYGVDLNALSVQLARLAVWIHTFVPGLPLSVLDHTLVRGNSLVGVGTVDDIRKKFEEATGTLFAVDAESLLGQAAKPLNRLANINDATLQDIAAAREAMREARDAIGATAALCDLIAAQPISDDERVVGFPFEEWERRADDLETLSAVGAARQDLGGLYALHFPIAFPEVFLRRRPGFDVILGNPPWQEVTVEEHAFWARHFPGLRSLPQREQEAEKARLSEERPDLVAIYEVELAEMDRVRKALVGGAYPGMGTGDPDLYKAFCWRFWHLSAAEGGRIGVVLPRSALSAKGSTDFRLTMFGKSENVDVTMLLNRAGWVFDEAEHRYTIGLVCVAHGQPVEKSIRLRGPYASLPAFSAGIERPASAFDREQVLAWNDTASLPLLPAEESVDVFAQLRKAPRLDLNVEGQWRARPDAELHATAQKPLMDLESEDCPDGFWPVYKGESFDIWNPDTGTYYAWADPEPVIRWLQNKRVRAGRSRRDSAHREFPIEHLRDRSTLPCFAPRVAFRDVSRSTDSRSVRVALVPPEVFITNTAPYLLWPRGDERDQAFLLGVLSSIPLDWYARRYVELHVNYFVFNPFPVPHPARDDARWRRVVELAGRLACPDDRFDAWAETVGVECGPLAADEKEDMIHELDAMVAHLYGLTEPQLVHIFETFHEGWDYEDRLDGVLRHYHPWKDRAG
jgi:hypothetical protein